MTVPASARVSAASPTTWRWKALICGAFVLAVWGAKLWIISRFGSPVPVNDEWDAHALRLFVPAMDSALSPGGLLAPHNEHRILTGRLVALLVFAANGSWDPILEMIVNAVIHVALGVCVLAVLGRRLDPTAFAALAVATAVLLAVPNASENPVWGLETHFYAVLLFGFAAIALMTRASDSFVRWGAGLAAATLAFLSLASGALLFFVAAAIIAAKCRLGVEPGRRGWPIAAALLACFALALALTPVIEAHKVYRAHTVGEFVLRFETLAAWPFRVHITAAALLVNAPFALLAWRVLRKPPAGDSVAWVLLGLGIWNGLQFAALGFARFVGGVDATRYLDICAFNLIVNFACAAVLVDGRRMRLVAAAWLAVIAAGWAVETARHVPQELAARRSLAVVQEANVRAFLTTGAFLPGASGADLSVPYPNAARLAQILSDPKVRRVLPSAFQDAAAGRPAADRLRGARDALLHAGPYLGIAGALLMLLLSAWPLLAHIPAKWPPVRR
jgi:hypothetical protein